MGLTIAFSTDDGKFFNNKHFGMAKYFNVYKFDVGREDFIETRSNVKYNENKSLKHGDSQKAKATSSVLKGIDVLAGKKFRPNIVRLLKEFVCVSVKTNVITDAIELIHENMEQIIEAQSKGEGRKHIILK